MNHPVYLKLTISGEKCASLGEDNVSTYKNPRLQFPSKDFTESATLSDAITMLLETRLLVAWYIIYL